MAAFIKGNNYFSPRDTAMVGDRLATDVLLGQRLGVTAVWVKTGDRSSSGSIKPDFSFQSMEKFIDECL